MGKRKLTKNGHGQCQVCGRSVASTAKGYAWRHGTRKVACKGSGYPLLGWRRDFRWDKTSITETA